MCPQVSKRNNCIVLRKARQGKRRARQDKTNQEIVRQADTSYDKTRQNKQNKTRLDTRTQNNISSDKTRLLVDKIMDNQRKHDKTRQDKDRQKQ